MQAEVFKQAVAGAARLFCARSPSACATVPGALEHIQLAALMWPGRQEEGYQARKVEKSQQGGLPRKIFCPALPCLPRRMALRFSLLSASLAQSLLVSYLGRD
jgi:hypothetical protein